MDEILRQILQEMKNLGEGQTRLETELGEIRGDLDGVKDELKEVRTDIDGVKGELKEVRTDIDGVKGELREVKELNLAIFDQVGMLTEFRTEMNQFRTEANARLDRIDETLNQHGKMINQLAIRSVAQEADINVLRQAK